MRSGTRHRLDRQAAAAHVRKRIAAEQHDVAICLIHPHVRAHRARFIPQLDPRSSLSQHWRDRAPRSARRTSGRDRGSRFVAPAPTGRAGGADRRTRSFRPPTCSARGLGPGRGPTCTSRRDGNRQATPVHRRCRSEYRRPPRRRPHSVRRPRARFAHRTALSVLRELFGDDDSSRGLDQGEMRESLREVAKVPTGVDVEFLGVQAQR
jgi:hypothetical protein